MLTKEDVAAAVLLDLLKRGYLILKKPKGRRRGADIIARDPGSQARIFVSAAGRTPKEAAAADLDAVHTESEVLKCMTSSVYSALRMHHEDQFSPADRIALAFPDRPECHRYLEAQKSFLDSIGVQIILVNEEKEVRLM